MLKQYIATVRVPVIVVADSPEQAVKKLKNIIPANAGNFDSRLIARDHHKEVSVILQLPAVENFQVDHTTRGING